MPPQMPRYTDESLIKREIYPKYINLKDFAKDLVNHLTSEFPLNENICCACEAKTKLMYFGVPLCNWHSIDGPITKLLRDIYDNKTIQNEIDIKRAKFQKEKIKKQQEEKIANILNDLDNISNMDDLVNNTINDYNSKTNPDKPKSITPIVDTSGERKVRKFSF